jgi:uncharacterized protein
MEKKVLIPLAAVILGLLVYGFFIKQFPKYRFPDAEQKTAVIGSKEVSLEIASTDSSRQRGLGGRTSLGTDNGMLFVFENKPVMASFWMKDMLIPLDIIWIKDGKINKIDKDVPFYPKDTPDNQLKIYNPGTPIDYVLEVNSGFCTTNNINVGDAVTLPAL